jgi:hypothetical protein
LTKSMIIEAKELGIKIVPENFPVSSLFDVRVVFTNLAYSPLLQKVSSN